MLTKGITPLLLLVQLAIAFASYNSNSPKQRVMKWDQAEKQHVLDMHNVYRAKIASGKVAGQPPAADMTALSWDDRLERHAKRWSLTCDGTFHDAEQLRRTGPHSWVGQNYAGHSDTKVLINYGLNGWFDEYANYDFQHKNCLRGMCGHYTQMVWSRSHMLGCAAAACRGHHMARFICNYAPGGNSNSEFPYAVGPACSRCPAKDGFVYCMDEALCATKKQCTNTRKAACKCLVNQQLCKANGRYDRKNCKCHCKKGYSGLNCQDACKDTIDYCDQGKAYCKPGNKYHTWMRRVCKLTCDFCRQKTYVDTAKANRLGLTVNTFEAPISKPNPSASKFHVDAQNILNSLMRSDCRNEDTDEYCSKNSHKCGAAGFNDFTKIFCCRTCAQNGKKRSKTSNMNM